MKWSYGITTVPFRINDLFPRTLESLKRGGFDCPHLFIDGCSDPSLYSKFNLPMAVRSTQVRTFGNWLLALLELYIREPHADRYAIFQDDFVTCLNLRQYLEASPYPGPGYLNLYTFPQNQVLCPPNHKGWYLSNQRGRGAVATVMDRNCVLSLLKADNMLNKPQDLNRGYKSVDGAIVTAMTNLGFKEWVHNPSLIMHTGEVSSIRELGDNRDQSHMARFQGIHSVATSFRGEQSNALELLACS